MAQPRARALAASLRLLERAVQGAAVAQARVGGAAGGAAERALVLPRACTSSSSSSSCPSLLPHARSATIHTTSAASLALRRVRHSGTAATSPLIAATPTLPTRPFSSAAADPATDQQQQQGVTLSDAAVARLHELKRQAGDHPVALRVEVEGGGCSGFQYVLRLEEGEEAAAPKDGDAVFERDGARVLVDEVSLGLLKGAVVDYEDTLMRSAFHVASNPNSEASCGCGSSFAAKGL